MITEQNTSSTMTLYDDFLKCSVKDLEESLKKAKTREEKAFYRSLLNLRLKMDQQKIVGKSLI